ncbi:TonB family protein [Pistricoccus aurantiacus]|uniref:Protein TonB n=1 Tax=Pistricoccus aurantiacus TaxID=1883414 RepID=A0A5B8SX49_9GAMM|nr:energy transducer TonB [Pistricoccus aurantiacus]QEA40135.1 TonB family protein [Pistricoccus aurantiacus]
MRAGVAILGGLLLTLLLFALLAQLVVPPQAPPELPRQVTLAMVEAPAQQEESPTPASASKAMPEPPTLVAAKPPPAPETPSPVSVPNTPPRETPPLETKIEPDPRPQPEPQPEPKPDPRPWARESSPAPSMDTSANPGDQAPAANTQGEAMEVATPTPTKRVPPEYPARAQRRGIEGFVEMRFTIRPDGSVEPGSIQVVDARPRRVFDQAARRAIADWAFPRAERPRIVTQRLEFQLR